MWVIVINEVQAGDGKLYLNVIKDLYDGAIALWKTSTLPTAKLVPSTVEWTLAKRPVRNGTILHSNHGSQDTSEVYWLCLQRNGLKIRWDGFGPAPTMRRSEA